MQRRVKIEMYSGGRKPAKCEVRENPLIVQVHVSLVLGAAEYNYFCTYDLNSPHA